MKSTPFATFGVVGFHHWPEAPDELAYLRDSHRHMFGFKVECSVGHDDREVEFHFLGSRAKIELAKLYPSTTYLDAFEFGSQSCEHIAGALLQRLRDTGLNVTAVTVLEDSENGARVEVD